jgi:Family of unknown function (DUF5689)
VKICRRRTSEIHHLPFIIYHSSLAFIISHYIKMKSRFQFLALSLLALLAFAPACVKTEFDEPPVGGSPVSVTANTTIAEIKKLYNGSRLTIADEKIIKGQVIMDDKSGNFYKTIVIQDATAGIELKFSDGYLYNKYPIGRNVYVNLKGLLLSDYNGVLSINGGTIVENGVASTVGITSAQADKQVFKGEFEALIAPKVKKINELLSADISTLVKLEGVEFTGADANQPYADASNQVTVNRIIEDCNQLTVILRSSGFSNFAASNTPSGKGEIVGVYSVFRQDQQFFIRDTNDVKLNGPRCGVNTNLTGINIGDLRTQFASGNTVAPADKKITGTVISDKSTNHTDTRNLIIQDGTGGVVARFTAAHSFNVGDQVDIDVSNRTMSQFQGTLQIEAIPANAAIKIGTATATPKELTISELKTNFGKYESTLVKIKAATFTTTGTYSGSKILMDATGDITHFTRGLATFSASNMPTGTIELVGIAGFFNTTQQVSIRSTADVTGGTPGGGGGTGGGTVVTSVNEPFDGVTNNAPFAATGWTNVAVKGTRTWLGKTFQTDKYAQATSFGSTDAEDEMWLISPPIDLSAAKTLNFRTAIAFYVHDGLSVVMSTNFDGTNVTGATWTPLTATLANAASGDNVWVPSGAVALPVAPKAYIAFKYVGNKPAGQTTSFRVDDVTVQ